MMLMIVLRAVAVSAYVSNPSAESESDIRRSARSSDQVAPTGRIHNEYPVRRVSSKIEAHAIPEPPKYNIVVCTQVHNEMRYLPEWIEYHRQIGVDYFRIIDDASTDGLRMLPALMKNASQTQIEYIEVVPTENISNKIGDKLVATGAVPKQFESFNKCLTDFASAARWIGIFDVDEFVALPSAGPHRNLRDLAHSMDVDTFQLQPVKFGSNSWDDSFLHGDGFVSITDSKRQACLRVRRDLQNASKYEYLTVSSHMLRGAHPHLEKDKFSANFDADVACREKGCGHDLPSVCAPGPGKSFFRGGKCARNHYYIHKCYGMADHFVPLETARLNHYYLRALGDVAKGSWGGSTRSECIDAARKADHFFNAIRDTSGVDTVQPEKIHASLLRASC